MVGSNDNGAVCARLERIERAITGQTRVVAVEGERSGDTLERIAGSVGDMQRKTALAEAA
jgi:hypothetical protein